MKIKILFIKFIILDDQTLIAYTRQVLIFFSTLNTFIWASNIHISNLTRFFNIFLKLQTQVQVNAPPKAYHKVYNKLSNNKYNAL